MGNGWSKRIQNYRHMVVQTLTLTMSHWRISILWHNGSMLSNIRHTSMRFKKPRRANSVSSHPAFHSFPPLSRRSLHLLLSVVRPFSWTPSRDLLINVNVRSEGVLLVRSANRFLLASLKNGARLGGLSWTRVREVLWLFSPHSATMSTFLIAFFTISGLFSCVKTLTDVDAEQGKRSRVAAGGYGRCTVRSNFAGSLFTIPVHGRDNGIIQFTNIMLQHNVSFTSQHRRWNILKIAHHDSGEGGANANAIHPHAIGII